MTMAPRVKKTMVPRVKKTMVTRGKLDHGAEEQSRDMVLGTIMEHGAERQPCTDDGTWYYEGN